MNITKLIEAVKSWGVSRGITGPNGKGTIERQFAKFIEELHEFLTAKTDEEKIDALGDLQVVAIQAHALVEGLDLKINVIDWDDDEVIDALAHAVSRLNCDPESSFNAVRSVARKTGFDPDECLQAAYDVISKRSGSVIDGMFVKDK